ncbi:MAG: HAD-IA family hydrolase [Verrucomicrobia bacterium]|nr:HAD-IA family hydrolase [Verrucomicrobiota bacterium]
MTGEPHREAVVHFIRESFQLSLGEFDKVNQEKRRAFEQGKMDAEFWVSYAEERGIELPVNWVEAFQDVMKEAIGINPEMYLLVGKLREQQMPVALLSNIDERLAKLLRDFGLYAPFNPCLLSCEMGIEKPDLRAYEFLLTELNLSAHEVVFIDDKLENVEAAKQLGIDAILFESPEQIRAALRTRMAGAL